jgi:hypothetical protein
VPFIEDSGDEVPAVRFRGDGTNPSGELLNKHTCPGSRGVAEYTEAIAVSPSVVPEKVGNHLGHDLPSQSRRGTSRIAHVMKMNGIQTP